MSIREFLHEQKIERKQMRAERKLNKKQPKTKKEKVYKVVWILFVLFLIFGSLYFAFRNVSSGYDFDKISGLTEEMQENLSKPCDIDLLLGDSKISLADEKSYKAKMEVVGLDDEQILEGDFVLPDSLCLNAKEVGVLCKNISSQLYSDTKSELLAFRLYYDILDDCFYEESVFKVYLNKYISNGNLPDVYIKTVSKCEVQNKQITALTYTATINNLTEEDSANILDVLNKNVIIYNFSKMCNDDINGIINIFNTFLSAKLQIENDMITFCK